MAWTSPMTAVANSTFTAAQFNTHVRDNLNETAPAKATTAGSLFVATGLNSIAERTPGTNSVVTPETTSSTSYTNLATSGPTATVTTGVAAIIIVGGHMENATAGASSFMSFEVSGASTVSPNDLRAMRHESAIANAEMDASKVIYLTPLTAGVNVFTAKYRVSAGSGTFLNRRIDIIPL